MTQPQRLIDAEDAVERDLIRSAHADRPSDRALERMLLGLGVEFSNIPSALSSPSAGATTSSKIGGAMLAKWLVTGAAIGLGMVGGAELVTHALERGPSPGQAPKPLTTRAPSQAAASFPVSPATPPRISLSTAQAEARPPVPAKRIAEVAGSPTPLTTRAGSEPSSSTLSREHSAVGSFESEPVQAPRALAEEMRLLDAARRDLASGAPRRALLSLTSYERTFPNGALRPEASVLKVRALLAVGDRAGAEALARQVIERAPRSEHAAAVRAALGAPTIP